MPRWPLTLAAAGAALLGACALLPERFAVNAPITNLLFGSGAGLPEHGVLEERIALPDGFHIGVFASGLRARTLRVTEAGDLLVSTPRDGKIVLLSRDADADGRADDRRTLLADLDRPYGMDFHGGWLYVAEGGAVGRIRFDPGLGKTAGPYERIVDGLPEGGNHWTRTLGFGPDGWMYVSIGSSCNACEERDPRRAAIMRYRPDGSGGEIFATGLRNAVGFDWRPGTDELFATDNGRDLLGDDFPPCELNRVERGGFYGWPYANGDRYADPDLGAGNEERIRSSISPVHSFRAHNAPLGITFVRRDTAPPGYRDAAFVALHGSWNRTHKDGYKVVSLHWQPDGTVVERDFAAGFERDGDVIGRPVDVAVGPDGAVYVSDDYAQAVYRIARGEAPGATSAPAPPRAGDPLAGIPARQRAEAAERGRALYEAHACYRCHEAARIETGVVLAPIDSLARHDVDSLEAFLAAPTPPMPTFDLDAEARRDLAIYLLSTDR